MKLERKFSTSYDKLKANFPSPPTEYGIVYIWFWNGEMEEKVIEKQLLQMKEQGVRGVVILAYYGLKIEYLSPIWFERVKYCVKKAKKLNMRVWIFDEGSYPSGCSGGKVTIGHPELQGKSLTLERIPVGGAVEVVQKMPEGFVGVSMVRRKPNINIDELEADEIVDLTSKVQDNWLRWKVPSGAWELLVFFSQISTTPFRYVHTGYKKDTSIPLPDYLKREATEKFIETTYEAYKRYIGDEFGKTVVGFFADEPRVPKNPWTDDFLKVFREKKGYDFQPYLPALFFEKVPLDVRRVRYDYYDVWSDLFRDRFSGHIAKWCHKNNLLFTMHICGEESPKILIKDMNGDYFKVIQPVDIPGIDVIWRQIWWDKEEDFPKLASSSAHFSGKTRAMSETNAVYGRGLSVEQAKWVADYQLVRGINLFFVMEFLSSLETFRRYWHPVDLSPDNVLWPYIKDYNQYISRVSYLLSQGCPGCKIAVYYPTTSIWAEDDEKVEQIINKTKLLSKKLLSTQRDFDYLSEEGLNNFCKVKEGKLVNQSGNKYFVVIIPECTVLSFATLKTLISFQKDGGMVIIFGNLPSIGGGLNQRESIFPLLNKLLRGSNVYHFSDEFSLNTEIFSEILPSPDVYFENKNNSIRYLHRRFNNGELYFFHNEGRDEYRGKVKLEGKGHPEIWEPLSGEIKSLPYWKEENGYIIISLSLEVNESKVIILAPNKSKPHIISGNIGEIEKIYFRKNKIEIKSWTRDVGKRELRVAFRDKIYEWEGQIPEPLAPLYLNGEWQLERKDGERIKISALSPWNELGWPEYSGEVSYTLQFILPEEYVNKVLILNLGEVRYTAKVEVNGEFMGARAWGPFKFNVTDKLHSGQNQLIVKVTNTNANEVMGNSFYLKELENSGLLKGSYFKIYSKFDREQMSSGLIGPVRIIPYEKIDISFSLYKKILHKE